MEKPQIFRSPTAVVVWVVWLLFAVGNWVDLAVQGRDHTSVVAAAILLLATGAAYVTAQRPRIIADDAGVTIRNPLRDHRIGWAGVAEVDLVDLLRVHCAWGGPPGAAPADREHHKVISAWAIHYSRRRQFAAEAAEKIVKLLQARAAAARAEAVWADSTVEIAGALPTKAGPAETTPAPGTDTPEPAPVSDTASAPAATATMAAMAATGWTEPLTSTWSRRALAALLIPALILLIVVLV